MALNKIKYDVNQIIKGFIFTGFGLVFAKFMGYIWRIYAARGGVEEYGYISLALTLYTLTLWFTSLGIKQTFGRFVIESYAKKNYKELITRLSSVVVFNTFTSILIASIYYYFKDFIAVNFFKDPLFTPYIVVIGLALPITTLSNYFYAYVRNVNRAIGFITLNRYIVLSSLKVALLLLFAHYFQCNLGLYGFLSYIFADILTTLLIIAYFTFKNKVYLQYAKVNILFIKEIIMFSYPIMLAGIISKFLVSMDSILINYFMGVSQTGIYNVAVPLGQLLLLPVTALYSLFIPITVSRYHQKDIKEVKFLFSTANRYLMVINAFIFAVLIIYGKEIIKLIFGPSYTPGYYALIILALHYFILSHSNMSQRLIIGIGDIKYIPKMTFIALSLNILLNIILIPSLGIVGGALATLVSYQVATFMNFRKVKEYINITSLDLNSLSVIFLSVVSLYVVNYLMHHIIPYFSTLDAIVFLIFSFALYSFIVVKTRIIKINELKYIYNIFRKKLSL